MKVLRKTVPEGSLVGSGYAGQMYNEMLDDALADEVAKGQGLGLRPMLERTLGGEAAIATAGFDGKWLGNHCRGRWRSGPRRDRDRASQRFAGSTRLHRGSQWPAAGSRCGVVGYGRRRAMGQRRQARCGGSREWFCNRSGGGRGALQRARCQRLSGLLQMQSLCPRAGAASRLSSAGGRQATWLGVPWAQPHHRKTQKTVRWKASGHAWPPPNPRPAWIATCKRAAAAFCSPVRPRGDRAGHMAIVERIHDIERGADGRIRRVVFDGWEARTQGASHLSRRTWNIAGNPGGTLARQRICPHRSTGDAFSRREAKRRRCRCPSTPEARCATFFLKIAPGASDNAEWRSTMKVDGTHPKPTCGG